MDCNTISQITTTHWVPNSEWRQSCQSLETDLKQPSSESSQLWPLPSCLRAYGLAIVFFSFVWHGKAIIVVVVVVVVVAVCRRRLLNFKFSLKNWLAHFTFSRRLLPIARFNKFHDQEPISHNFFRVNYAALKFLAFCLVEMSQLTVFSQSKCLKIGIRVIYTKKVMWD